VGIPLGYDALTLYINEDIFARAGKTPPATWDDFRQLALELTTKDENGNIVISGAALGRTENVDHWQEIVGLMMMQNGVDLSNPTGQLAQDAIVFYTVFSKVDGVWNETLPPSTVSFANGNVAMYLAPTWRAFEIQQINPDLRFRTVPVPQLPKDNPNEPDITYATYWVEGVWGRSTNREVAWEFLRFLSSRQSLEKMYENASQTRLFGEPYPRSDMADLVSSHPIIGSVIRTAPNAKSWYLADRTRDGETGINSQIASYFEDTVNTASERTLGVEQLNTLSNGISQVLSQYGLLRR
jgi:ABC-type glycerol-3-phosphate transport system substrate-binding protein